MQEHTLIANSGIQIITFPLRINTQEKFKMWYHEWYDTENGEWRLDPVYELRTDDECYYYNKQKLHKGGYLSDPTIEIDVNELKSDDILPLRIEDENCPGVRGDIFSLTFSDKDNKFSKFEKGNAYLYGNFVTNSQFTVKYEEAPLATHKFSQATVNAKSYALDATVVSLTDEGITHDQIVEDVKKELDAGKTYINLILAPDVDEETLEAINIGLKDARDGSINLTLIGCKKIPSRGFMHFDMLKSIALPDVTEIGENAFLGCTELKKVVLGNLTKVYGNVGKKGIFDGCRTKDIDLVLSKDQKVMNGGETEGGYCWTADITKLEFNL